MLKAEFYSGGSEYVKAATAQRSLKFPLVLSTTIDNISINRSIETIETFNFSFIINQTNLSSFPLDKGNRPVFVKIFYYDELLIKGVMYSYDFDFLTQTVNCSCNGLTYLLNYLPASPSAITNKKPVLGSLQGLLDYWDETDSLYNPFKIVRFFNVQSPVKTSTTDLRQEEKLLSQFDKLTKYAPRLYYRVFDEFSYAHSLSLGVYTYRRVFLVEVGAMDYDTGFVFDNKNITNFSIQKIVEPDTKHIIPFGGLYKTGTPATVPQRIDLIDYDGSYGVLDADFTIFDRNNGNPDKDVIEGVEYDLKISTDLGITNIDSNDTMFQGITKYYDDLAPETQENPTNAEKVEMAYAVYQQAISELEVKENVREFSIGANDFDKDIMPGNVVYLQYDVANMNYNDMSQQSAYTSLDNLSFPKTPLYVKSININIDSSGTKNADLVLTEDNKFYTKNKLENIVGNYKNHLRRDGEYALVLKPKYVSGFYEYTISGVASNSTYNGNPSYLTTVNKIAAADFGSSNSIPVNATPVAWYSLDIADKQLNYDNLLSFFGLTGCDYIYNDVYKVVFGTIPEESVANFTFHVQKYDNWTVNDSITVKILVIFDVT